MTPQELAKSNIRVVKGTKGVKIVRPVPRRDWDEEIHTSYMEIAKFLFDLKDFLQASRIGRDCLDDVSRLRRGKYLTVRREERGPEAEHDRIKREYES